MANYSGGVLTKATNSYLFNEPISRNDIGVYTDSKTNLPVLLIKKHGYSIEINSKAKASMTCNHPGTFRSLLVTLNPDCPCNECNYEYGFKVLSKVQRPGHNNSMTVPQSIGYFGSMENIECDQGKILNSQVLQMENDIINQINTYQPSNQNGLMPAQRASRYYVLEDSNTAASSTVNILLDGVTHAISSTLAPTFTTLVEAINTNAALIGKVKAMYLTDPNAPSYRFAVFADVFESNINIFELIAGTNVFQISRQILLISRDERLNIFVELNPSIGSVEEINIAKIVRPTTSAGYHLTFGAPSVASATYGVNMCGLNTPLNIPAQFQYLLSSAWHLTRYSQNVIYAFSGMDNAYINYEPSDWAFYVATKKGSWEVLSDEMVIGEFLNQPNYGKLTQFAYKNQAIKGMRYCKLNISWEYEIADLVGANHMGGRVGAISLYFPMNGKCLNTFASTDFMGENINAPLDRTIVGFLAIFGLVV